MDTKTTMLAKNYVSFFDFVVIVSFVLIVIAEPRP
jgi:hypothetical protein